MTDGHSAEALAIRTALDVAFADGDFHGLVRQTKRADAVAYAATKALGRSRAARSYVVEALRGRWLYAQLAGPNPGHGPGRGKVAKRNVSDGLTPDQRSRWRQLYPLTAEGFNAFVGAVADDEWPTFEAAVGWATGGRRLEAVYSSGSDEWETPADLFAVLDAEFRFGVDVCASSSNAKCKRYFTRDDDGLAQDWRGRCWMNPPYGDVIGAWMGKAHAAANAGATVVCLVPARTDTAWWWEHARHGEVRFLRGRLRFGDGNTAPFPSAVVVLGVPAAVVWWEWAA